MGNNKFGYGTSLRSFTIPSDKRTLSVSAGQNVTLRLSVTYYSYTGAVGGAGQCQAPITYTRSRFSYGVSADQYVCRYSTNGLMLNGSNNKFFGFNNTATNNENEVLLARSGNFGMSLMNKGLMLCTFSGTTITRYRMNPLVGIVKIDGRNGAQNLTNSYNPLGNNVTCSRANNRYKVTHNLNNSNLAFQVMGFGSNIYGYVYNIDNANNVTIETSVANAQFLLYIYDYSTY